MSVSPRAGEELWLALGLSLLVFADAVAVLAGWTAPLDRWAMLALAPPPGRVRFVGAVTWFGNSATRTGVAVIAAMLLLIARDWRRALALGGIVAGGAALDSGIKLLVARPRPDLLPHLDHVTSFSFPSGHAANGAILYLSLALLVPARWRRWAIGAAAVLVLAIGLSRVALAVHWPSDVAAGWCLGLGWIILWRNLLARPASG